jgi:putative peptidoglycan lipid II flippase
MPHASGAVVRRVAVAALLIAAGNIASRLIGMVREAVIAGLFGRGADVAAFTAASTVPTIVYDLLVNGAISAALVPVFSAYAEEDEAAFWQRRRNGHQPGAGGDCTGGGHPHLADADGRDAAGGRF